jgi:hypothetical protein
VLMAIVLVGGFVFREKRATDRRRNDRELR